MSQKEDIHSDTFKLISFNTYDYKPKNNEESDSDDDTKKSKFTKKNEDVFQVQMFGINEKGQTASMFLEGYLPFFYVLVSDKWNEGDVAGFKTQIKQDIGKFYEESILSTKLFKKKKLYGFDAGLLHTFLYMSFKSEAAMRKVKNLWYDSYTNKNGDYVKVLIKDGYEYNGEGTILYEAQIPPLLRLFHINEISPSGWVSVPKSSLVKNKSTTCDYEYIVEYKKVLPLPHKETRVPYKICSFDIEASSSHGDFPLAVKNYKKLATNILDTWSEDKKSDYLRCVINTAFGFDGYKEENIDKVYPIQPLDEQAIQALYEKWIKIKPAVYKNTTNNNADADEVQEPNIHIWGGNENVIIDEDADTVGDDADADADSDGDDDAGGAAGGVEEITVKKKKFVKAYTKRTATVVDLLNDAAETRDTKLMELTRTLTDIFPKLKGDIVTFIGSTFVKYGEDKPYLNHCIVRDTCDSIPIPNSVIESYPTEKEVLLAWTKLIQKENPDIIIGYNIFGFDYQFMYLRAQELGCERKFLELSRNRGEVCLKKNWKTGKEGLEENTLVIASGQHDLKFIKMTGRLQIDLYNYFRRDFQLIKYKLDYVAGYFIGDDVKSVTYNDKKTIIKSKNLTGLENGSYISFEEELHSSDAYKNGQKFVVSDINPKAGTFAIDGKEEFDMKKKIRWGLAKDDVTPQDIFRMTNEGPAQRAIIAKYCIQDCNLVHHLMNKIDVITGYTEMASLCSVPMDFLVMRGQGIKLTSFIAKKCRERNTLMPVLDKAMDNEGYEGAIVLPPKCDLYLDDPVACVDYSSLYPSSMISENISHDSKVSTREYDLNGKLLATTGERDPKTGKYIYDNLPGYQYVDITYDTFKWQRKNNNPKAGMEKVKTGYKTCRFAQFPEGKAIMPSILEELLSARKATRALAAKEKDPFMQNILDKRQLSIKVTANSMYGQTGAKTSSFYEKDCAASTTSMGRKFLTYGRRVIEEAYANRVINTKCYGEIRTDAEYVYGDTDSVFFKFNVKEMDGTPIKGKKALEITIELAQQAGKMASMFLKNPHDLVYEKTFLPFCLLSKKRYVGMLYENDPNKCKRKSMGIVLKRRDNAPIVKDIYGGVIDILMKEQNVDIEAAFLKTCLQNMVDEKYGMDKLIITKSLRSGYKNPKQIAHKVLADRIGKRDAGNKPNVGDRIPFVFIENPDKKALQGDRIETPDYIIANKLKINYSHYITNQIMKPLQQLFALVLEKMETFKSIKSKNVKLNGEYRMNIWNNELKQLKIDYPDEVTYIKKEQALRNKEVKILLFDEFLLQTGSLKPKKIAQPKEPKKEKTEEEKEATKKAAAEKRKATIASKKAQQIQAPNVQIQAQQIQAQQIQAQQIEALALPQAPVERVKRKYNRVKKQEKPADADAADSIVATAQ
jgi:DNA polymerase elongation subunit (family B)